MQSPAFGNEPSLPEDPSSSFLVAGLQLTVLKGQPCLLVPVQWKNIKASSPGSPTNLEAVFLAPKQAEEEEGEEEEEVYLSSVLLRTVLQPLLSMDSISDSISPAVLASLEPALAQPLTSFLSYQEGLTHLNTPVSFYWSSGYQHSCLPGHDTLLKSSCSLDVTVCTLGHTSLGNPCLVFAVLSRVFESGLDLAGVRLLFEPSSFNGDSASPPKTTIGDEALPTPTLALALRGPDAMQRWVDALGPEDSTLARVTDPTSFSAMFGKEVGAGPGLMTAVQGVRNFYQRGVALARWFGGRACLKTGAVFGMSDARTKFERRKRQRVRFSESESEDSLVSSPLPVDLTFPPLISNLPRLLALPYSKVLLVVSPSVPPSCYACMLASCDQLGFDVFGAKRIRLNAKRASSIDIPAHFLSHFTPSSTPPSPLIPDASQPPSFLGGGVSIAAMQAPPPLPSVVILIGRENAVMHCAVLKRLILQNLSALLEVNSHVEMKRTALDLPGSILHTIPYSEEKLKVFGSFTASIQSISDSDLHIDDGKDESCFREELCFVAVIGTKNLPLCIRLLNSIYREASPQAPSAVIGAEAPGEGGASTDCDADDCIRFELVGMRIVPQLSRFHAKKLCPVPMGDSLHSQAIQLLSDKPASLLVFRGVSCNGRLQEHVGLLQGSLRAMDLEKRLRFVVSGDFCEGVHLTSLFFSGRDLFGDSGNRILAPYLPESWVHQTDILQGLSHFQESLFSVVWFPLAQLKLGLKLLSKISRSGFTFAGISTLELTTNTAGEVRAYS